jgi:hypothetical protein
MKTDREESPRGARAARTKLFLAAGVAVVLAVATGAAAGRFGDQHTGTGVDRDAVARDLAALVGPAGRVQLPLRPGQPSLEMTAWVRSVATASRVDLPALEPRALDAVRGADAADMAVWNTYYAALAVGRAGTEAVAPAAGASVESGVVPVHTAPEAEAARLAPYARDNGTYAEEPAQARSRDAAYLAMTTWAGTTAAGSPHPRRTAAWARGQLRACAGNPFVLHHIAQTLALLAPKKAAAARAGVACCLEPADLLAPVDYPRNEEELLGLVGRALALRDAGWPAPADAAAYRRALAPADWAWIDPWWAHHSMEGFMAAGGDPAAYRPTAQRWAGMLDADGLMPELSENRPTLEQDLFAALAAENLGVDGHGPSGQQVTALASSAESAHWGQADHALWGLLASVRSAPLDQKQSLAAREAAVRCSGGDVALVSMRRQWLCGKAASALGAPDTAPRAGLPEGFLHGLQPVEGIEAATLFGVGNELERLRGHVAAVLARPTSFPTHTLAQTLILAHRHPELDADAGPLAAALAERHAGGDHDSLYSAGPGQRDIDLYATFWVSQAESELLR